MTEVSNAQPRPRFPWILPLGCLTALFFGIICLFSILPSAGNPGLVRVTDADAALETMVSEQSTIIAQTPQAAGTEPASPEATPQQPIEPIATQPNRATGDVWQGQELSTQWYLAEGITKFGYLTFITLLNPNDTPANITVIYTLEDGVKLEKKHTITAGSPLTLLANSDEEVGNDRVFVTDITSDVPIAVRLSVFLDNGH